MTLLCNKNGHEFSQLRPHGIELRQCEEIDYFTQVNMDTCVTGRIGQNLFSINTNSSHTKLVNERTYQFEDKYICDLARLNDSLLVFTYTREPDVLDLSMGIICFDSLSRLPTYAYSK